MMTVRDVFFCWGDVEWCGLVWYSDWGEGFVSSCSGLCVDMGCWEGDSRVHLNLAISTGIVCFVVNAVG